MNSQNIEIRLYLHDEGLAKEEVERIPKDLETISKIAFMIKGEIKGIRRVYTIEKRGKFAGYRIEDYEIVKDLFLYSDISARKEISLEEIDVIQKTLAELKNHSP